MNKDPQCMDEAHLFRMTDDTGMFQHALYSVPNLSKGYTTDDNARALIMAVMLYEKMPKPVYLELIYRYLGFVLYSQNEGGRFRNFMNYSREFLEAEGSEDCFGRCMWALGYTQASTAMPAGIKEACTGAAERAQSNILALCSPRAQAYTLIGLSYFDNPAGDCLISCLADSLIARFENSACSEDWQWFEDVITYDNAVLPWALFAAYNHLGQARMLQVARKSLDFLDKISFRDGFFRPIGCQGWLMRGSELAQLDEQTLEACTSTLAHLEAHKAGLGPAMLEAAHKSLAWYQGENSCRKSLIDTETGGCCDGITETGLNRNQGAESIVSYAIASLAIQKCVSVRKNKSLSIAARQ